MVTEWYLKWGVRTSTENHLKAKIGSKTKITCSPHKTSDKPRRAPGECRRRPAPSIGLQSLFRAEVGQTDESVQTADIHEQLSIMAIAHANVRQNFG